MNRSRSIRKSLALAATLLIPVASALSVPVAGNTTTANAVDFTADFRLRGEYDWDSQTSSGSPRPDRERIRIRARIGLDYVLSPRWRTGARLRTGEDDSQQSPHVTIFDDDNPEGDADVVADRWYLAYQGRHLAAWGGRNTFSFWKQNELFWDDDVTPLGAHFTLRGGLLPEGVALHAGAFTLPDGMQDFNGALYGGQAVYERPLAKGRLILAGGFFRFDGKKGAENLLDGNGARDYAVWTASGMFEQPLLARPLRLGLDLYYNSADNATDDERDGYVLSAEWGTLKERNQWLAGYYYARIERLAVNASFAQDDWMRFGTASQTRASNFRGHELRLGYAVTPRLNILARLYLVESLASVEDGNRFRLDFNYTLPW